MHSRLLRYSGILLGLCVLLGSMAMADDLIPPNWRGSEGSTFQQWLFNSNSTTSLPDAVVNMYGTPVATIAPGDFAQGWISDDALTYGARTGMWDLGEGTMSLDIPNRPVALPYKDIWVQVTYFVDLSAAPTISVEGGTRMGGQTLTLESVPDQGGTWFLDQSMWRITPNPNRETITITGDASMGSVIDQVVVDTQCVPEPASMMSLLAGGLGLLISRRRRRS